MDDEKEIEQEWKNRHRAGDFRKEREREGTLREKKLGQVIQNLCRNYEHSTPRTKKGAA